MEAKYSLTAFIIGILCYAGHAVAAQVVFDVKNESNKEQSGIITYASDAYESEYQRGRLTHVPITIAAHQTAPISMWHKDLYKIARIELKNGSAITIDTIFDAFLGTGNAYLAITNKIDLAVTLTEKGLKISDASKKRYEDLGICEKK